METNNLTPDENLKEPIYFNKDEGIDNTCDEVETSGVVYGDRISDEEFADSGVAVVYCFIGLFVVLTIILVFVLFNTCEP